MKPNQNLNLNPSKSSSTDPLQVNVHMPELKLEENIDLGSVSHLNAIITSHQTINTEVKPAATQSLYKERPKAEIMAEVHDWLDSIQTLPNQQKLTIFQSVLSTEYEEAQTELNNKNLTEKAVLELKTYIPQLKLALNKVNHNLDQPSAKRNSSERKRGDDEIARENQLLANNMPLIRFSLAPRLSNTETISSKKIDNSSINPQPAKQLTEILHNLDVSSKSFIVAYILSEVTDETKDSLTNANVISEETHNVGLNITNPIQPLPTVSNIIYSLNEFFKMRNQVNEQVNLFQAFELWYAQQSNQQLNSGINDPINSIAQPINYNNSNTNTINQTNILIKSPSNQINTITQEFAQAMTPLFTYLSAKLDQYNQQNSTPITPQQLAAGDLALKNNLTSANEATSQQDFLLFMLESGSLTNAEQTIDTTKAPPNISKMQTTISANLDDKVINQKSTLSHSQCLTNHKPDDFKNHQSTPDPQNYPLLQLTDLNQFLQFTKITLDETTSAYAFLINHQVLLGLFQGEINLESQESTEEEEEQEGKDSAKYRYTKRKKGSVAKLDISP